MSLCGYCNSKKLFSNLNLHKCKLADDAAHQKLENEVLPILTRITSVVIKKMKIDEEEQIPPVLLFDHPHYGTKINLSELIKYSINHYMAPHRIRTRYILSKSVDKIIKLCLTYKTEHNTEWAFACFAILSSLKKNGVQFHGKFCGSLVNLSDVENFFIDTKRLDEIMNRFIENYSIEEPKPQPKLNAPTGKDNIVLYMRTSTSGQCANSQNRLLLEYCIKNNLRVSKTYEDVASARVQDGNFSPSYLIAFKNMIREIKDTCILVTCVDRFGRNVAFIKDVIEQLHKKNCYVYTLAGITSHDPKFMEKISSAENTSDDMSERMEMINA